MTGREASLLEREDSVRAGQYMVDVNFAYYISSY